MGIRSLSLSSLVFTEPRKRKGRQQPEKEKKKDASQATLALFILINSLVEFVCRAKVNFLVVLYEGTFK